MHARTRAYVESSNRGRAADGAATALRDPSTPMAAAPPARRSERIHTHPTTIQPIDATRAPRHGRFHAQQPLPRNQPMPTVNVYGTDTIASSGRAPPWGLGHDPPTALSGLGGATATREAQEG